MMVTVKFTSGSKEDMEEEEAVIVKRRNGLECSLPPYKKKKAEPVNKKKTACNRNALNKLGEKRFQNNRQMQVTNQKCLCIVLFLNLLFI